MSMIRAFKIWTGEIAQQLKVFDASPEALFLF